MAAETVRLTREELYDLAWSEPMRRLAERFNISDVGLKKICQRMNVPVPGLGYWRRKETGHAPRQTKLPYLPPGARVDREVTLTKRVTVVLSTDLAGGVTGTAANGAAPGRPVSRAAAQEAYEAAAKMDPVRVITVADSLDAAAPLHPLVERTARALRKAKADDRGGLTPGAPALMVSVTLGTVDRALRILDALVKAIEARGYRVTDDSPPARPDAGQPGYGYNRQPTTEPAPRPHFRVLVGDHAADAVEVTLAERVDTITTPVPEPPLPVVSPRRRRAAGWSSPTYQPPRPPKVEYVGTGDLTLWIANVPSWLVSYDASDRPRPLRQSWADGSRQRLERVLNSVVVGIVAAGEARTVWRLRREEQERQWQEAERRRLEEQRRREEEAARVQELDRQIAAAAKAVQIRTYTAALRAAAQAGQNATLPDGPLLDWLVWAEAYADQIDPVRRIAAGEVAPFARPKSLG